MDVERNARTRGSLMLPLFVKEKKMEKNILTEVKNIRERARTKRIEELKNKIHLYKHEMKRWKQELAQLNKGEK